MIEYVVDDSRESSRKSLLVIADDISDDALETLIINVKRGAFSSVAVKAPGLNMQRDFWEDIAIATGGIVVVHASLLGGITLSQLGFAKQVEVSKDSTWLIEPRADKSLVASRAAGIRQQILLTRDDHERERLRERLAKLTGSTCVIRVGGASSLDREERKYRIDAALHAMRSARMNGVVLGGGSALWRAAMSLRGKRLLKEGVRSSLMLLGSR